MTELSQARKNKITLSDYNYRSDLENRLLMAQFSTLDLEVLEEILYSPLTIPLQKLVKNIGAEEEEILPTLERFSKNGLLTIENETILVDKEMRKYYESQIQRFDDAFTPGMEFLQGLLRKVPIHVLPTWYSIPRTSNNIIESLIEKYLLTPQTFQRYLSELHFSDPVLTAIIHDLFHSPDFKISSQDLIEKFGLTREQFEEHMLLLEFSFVCCLGYNKEGDLWKEVVTPYEEWRDYLRFVRDTETKPIADISKIIPTRSHDFAFVEDMSAILRLAKKQPIPLADAPEGQCIPEQKAYAAILAKCEGLKANDPFAQKYVQQLLSKLRLIKLADSVDQRLYALESANDWLDRSLENRALSLYRHSLNVLLSETLAPHLCTERNIRECERSIIRVLHKGWVYFDDFLQGVLVTLSENSIIMLKKTGKSWKYTLPQYTDEEKALIKATLFDWLFEMGIVATGTLEGRECFRVTAFGQSFFEV